MIPVYTRSFWEAYQRGEVDEYRTSKRENVACKKPSTK